MTQRSEARFKYRLKTAFINVFGAQAATAKASIIRRDHPCYVPKATLKADLNIRISEKAEIPDSRLERYAGYLQVTVDFLKADYLEFKNRNKTAVKTKVSTVDL